jgi:hypothetical protein
MMKSSLYTPAFFLTALLLTACGGGGDSASTPTPAPAPKPVVEMALPDTTGTASVLVQPTVFGAEQNITGVWKTRCIPEGTGSRMATYTFADPADVGSAVVNVKIVKYGYSSADCTGTSGTFSEFTFSPTEVGNVVSGFGQDFTGSTLAFSVMTAANPSFRVVHIGFVNGVTTQARINVSAGATPAAVTFSHNQEIFYKQ